MKEEIKTTTKRYDGSTDYQLSESSVTATPQKREERNGKKQGPSKNVAKKGGKKHSRDETVRKTKSK